MIGPHSMHMKTHIETDYIFAGINWFPIQLATKSSSAICMYFLFGFWNDDNIHKNTDMYIYIVRVLGGGRNEWIVKSKELFIKTLLLLQERAEGIPERTEMAHSNHPFHDSAINHTILQTNLPTPSFFWFTLFIILPNTHHNTQTNLPPPLLPLFTYLC